MKSVRGREQSERGDFWFECLGGCWQMSVEVSEMCKRGDMKGDS